MFCKKCGARLAEGAKFCGACGAKVEIRQTKGQGSGKTGKPRKGLGKVIAIVLVLALLAGAAVVVLPMVSRKTVYLPSEMVLRMPEYKKSLSWQYNEDGKILSYEVKPDVGGVSVEYEYENGRIVAAEFEFVTDEFRLEYEYDKNGKLEAVEGDGFAAEVECDKEGRILETEVEYDYMNFEMSYSYHSNGMVKSADYFDGTQEEHDEFSETGDLLETSVKINGAWYYYAERDYNKNGDLRRESESYFSYGQQTSDVQRTYRYDSKGRLTGFTEEITEYGAEASVECNVIRQGNVEEFIITDLSGDLYALGINGEDMEEDDVYMEREYDKHGNMIREENHASEMVIEYEYISLKVPRDYLQTDIYDPEYFYDACRR